MLLVPMLLIKDDLPGQMGGGRFGERRMANQSAGSGIRQNAIDLHNRQSRIDRDNNDAQPTAGIDELDVLGPIGKQERQAIAGLKSGEGEFGSQHPYGIMELPKIQEPATSAKRRPIAKISDRPFHGMDVHH